MKENTALWDEVCVTAPWAVKPITGKSYKGNSPKPYWLIERATEVFGPCGIGWGVEVVNERFERFGDTESMHFATVRVWYVWNEKKGHVEQMGGTRAAYMSGQGKFIVDEDAPKKSVTDGMVKCLSMIGFAGDIFSGRWDDSKYVEWAAEETHRREAAALPEPEPVNVISADQAIEIADLMQETKTNKPAFLAWVSKGAGFDIADIEGIPVAAYPHVIEALKKKRSA